MNKRIKRQVSMLMVLVFIGGLFMVPVMHAEEETPALPYQALIDALGENDFVIDNLNSANDPAVGRIDLQNVDGATGNNRWGQNTSQQDYENGLFYGTSSHRINNGNGATAVYTPVIPQAGIYEVYITFIGASNRANEIPYEIFHNGENSNVIVDQTSPATNGSWVSIGEFYFSKGTDNYVKINTADVAGWVMVDAIRFAPILLDETDLDDDASLSSLIVDPSPGAAFTFDPTVTEYNFSVFNAVDSIQITATVTSAAYQSLTINETPTASGSTHTEDLDPGSNTILIKVTAQDGATTLTYSLNITRLSHDGSLSNNANLSSLTVDPGMIVFDPETLRYSLVLDSDVENIEITPAVESDLYQGLSIKKKLEPFLGDPTAQFVVIEADAQSGNTYTIELTAVEPRSSVGNTITPVNTIAIDVTAEDDFTVRTYTITVIREPLDPLEDEGLRDELGEHDIIVDNTDPSVTREGIWSPSRFNPRNYFGNTYENVQGTAGLGQTIRYNPTIPESGLYEVYTVFNSATNRANNVKYEIFHLNDETHEPTTTTVYVNQSRNGGIWFPLGTYYFAEGSEGYVRIDSSGANGFVMADAMRFVVPSDDDDDGGEEQPSRIYEPVGPVIFRSGFEEGSTGVTISNNPGTIVDITGVDNSVEEPNDWVAHLENNGYFGTFGIQYQSGTNSSDERYARIIEDPTVPDGSSNRVLHYWLGDVGDTVQRGRIQAVLNGNAELTEIYYRYRMYLHPDLELLKDSFDSYGFTAGEFWNQPSWETWSEYPFRVALLFGKSIGVGSPFTFRVHGQTTPITGSDEAREFVTIWEEDSNWSVPTGVWLEAEMYYKVGDADNGRIYFAVTPEGGEKQVLIDATNWTYHPASPEPTPLTNFHPLKLYSDRELPLYLKERGAAAQIYWDDLEFYPSVQEVLSSDATLSSLAINPGTLTFEAETASYQLNVNNSVASIAVTPTVSSAVYKTLTVNEENHESGTPVHVPLAVGSNTITIVVTAQDDTQMTYTIEVTRAAWSGGYFFPPLENDDSASTDTDLELETELDHESGTASSRVELSAIEAALQDAVPDNKGIRRVTFRVKATEGASAYAVVLPSTALTGKPDQMIEVLTSIATVSLPGDLLQDVESDDVSLIITAVDSGAIPLNSQARASIGGRPLISVKLQTVSEALSWAGLTPVKVSIPYTPTTEEQADPEHIVIWSIDAAGEITPVTSGGYDAATGMVTFITNRLDAAAYAVSYVVKTFEDTAAYGWAEKQIQVLASKGVIQGTTETTYSPEANISRADFLTLLVRTLDLQARLDSNFGDIAEDAYYAQAVGVARQLGITNGIGNNQFNPYASITRQDLFALTARALEIVEKLEAAGTETTGLSSFTDESDVAGYAAVGIASLIEEGIVQGDGQQIRPLDNTTRAEAAVILYRIYNK